MRIRTIMLLLFAGLLIAPLPGCGAGDEVADQENAPDSEQSAKDTGNGENTADAPKPGSGTSATPTGDDDDGGGSVDLSEFFPKDIDVSTPPSAVTDLKFEDHPYVEKDGDEIRAKGTSRRYTNGTVHRQGKFTYYYADGKPQSSGDYALNKKIGTWTFWYEDGKKSKEGPYVDGFADGKWTTWNADGKVRSEGYYRRSKQVGQWTFYDAAGAKTTHDFGGQPQIPEQANQPEEADP